MQWLSSVILLILILPLSAAQWLEPGVHELPTKRAATTCTLIVPPAITDGKPLPVLVVLAQDGKPDAKRWQEWGERRGCVVVGIHGLRWTAPIGGLSGNAGGWTACVQEAEEAYGAMMVVLKNSVPVHPFLRFITGTKASMPLAVAITKQFKEEFGGLLMITPGIDSSAVGELRSDVPLVMVVADDENALGMARKVTERLITDGGTARIATCDAASGEEPSFDVHTRAIDWLMNISRVTHGKFSARERKTNLDEIAKQAQELAGLVNPGARRECAGFLMTVPGMDKLRREYERLADTWVESSIEVSKQLEAKDPVDAHEFLSVLVKGQRYNDATVKQQRAAQAELTRLRKNPLIKKEIAAADLVADTCAMLDHDDSLAKQRIALKDLQAVMAQYPMTHAAKAAAKLVTKIQRNLR